MLNLNWTGAKILIRNSQGKYGSNLEAIDTKLFIKQDSFFEINIHTDEVQNPISFYNKITNVARSSCGATDRFYVFQQLNLITYWHWFTLHVVWKPWWLQRAQRVYFLLRSFCVNEEWGNHSCQLLTKPSASYPSYFAYFLFYLTHSAWNRCCLLFLHKELSTFPQSAVYIVPTGLCRGWKAKQVFKGTQLTPSRMGAVGMGMNRYGVHTVWIKERLREISARSAAQTYSSGCGHVTDFLSNKHFCFSKCLIKSSRSSFNRRHQVLGRQNHFYVLHSKMNFLPC